MTEFKINKLRRLAVNATASKNSYQDQTGEKTVSNLGKALLEALDVLEKK